MCYYRGMATEPYSPEAALAAAAIGRAEVEVARSLRKRLRRRTNPGSPARREELERELARVRESKKRLRRFNARAPYYAVPEECQAVADELRLEYQQLWKMLKRGEGRA